MDLTTDPDILAGYLTDASNTHGAADALARPRSAEEVAAVVARCQREQIPLTVTARRTSTTGGPVPRGGWLLRGLMTDWRPSAQELCCADVA